MHKNSLKLLLTALVLSWGLLLHGGEIAEAAQIINAKALADIDDIIKEVNNGELSLRKEGLITLRGFSNNDNTYLDVFASVFGKDASASSKRKLWENPNPDASLYVEKPKYQPKPNPFFPHLEELTEWQKSQTVRVPVYEGEPKFYRPAVSQKIYNGKRALMFHNIAPNGSLKYFFKALSNTRTDITQSPKHRILLLIP